jgi:transposase-like protein
MFVPPFCPHTDCPAHHTPPPGRWYLKKGTYTTELMGPVQRYVCRICARGFSDQTFSIDYYAKRLVPYGDLVTLLASCCSIRAIGRYTRRDHKTITNKLMRFARQALAVHLCLADGISLSEDLVADGFQSFWVSQYFPNNLNILVGADSQYLYAFNGITIRRSGRMTEEQKKERDRLEKKFRADPGGIRRSFSSLLDHATRLVACRSVGTVCLRTDEHIEYLRAVKSHGAFLALQGEGAVRHSRYSSMLPRTRHNPLFAVNYLDRQMRKDLAEHVRETTRHSRDPNHTMERLAAYSFHHNYIKRYRIRAPRDDTRTHAGEAGIPSRIVDAAMSWVYRYRAFLSRLPFTTDVLAMWLRMYERPLRDEPAYLPRFLRA